jgi:hypothetical protein
MELEEISGDARVALSQCAEQSKVKDGKENDRMSLLAKVTSAKQNAEQDKDTLIDIVRRLLVRPGFMDIRFPANTSNLPGRRNSQPIRLP